MQIFFIKNVKSCVLGFSDQVPWWGLVGQTEQLYFEDELARAADNKRPHMRGFDNDEASTFRITVELRQVILNYFGDEAPVGIMGKHCWWLEVGIAGLTTFRMKVTF